MEKIKCKDCGSGEVTVIKGMFTKYGLCDGCVEKRKMARASLWNKKNSFRE